MYKKSEIMKKGSYKTGQIAKLLGIAAPTVIRYCEVGVIKASKNQNAHRRIEASDFYDVDDEVNPKTQSEELAENIISLIHSFSGKLYGLRNKIKQELMAEDSKDE